MFTQNRLESVEAARLQLIDLGDEKTAKTLNWVVLALGCIHAGVQAQDQLTMLVVDLMDHINALTEQLGDAAPDQRELLAKVNAWLEQREQQVQAQVMRDFGQSALAALRQIADPVSYFQSQVQPGGTLDGSMAIRLSNDPEWLKGVAREAIADIEKGSPQ